MYTISIQGCDTIMAKNKVIHARLDDETHDQLFEKCNELGCSFTEYIAEVVKSSLEDDQSDLEPKEPEPVAEVQNSKVILLD